MDASRTHAASLRAAARQLIAVADELDPPVMPAKASPVARLLCPDCGTEYHGPEYRHGDPCLTVGCVGLISRKSDLARPDIATCDVCGLRISNGRANDGEECGAQGIGECGLFRCPGHFRLDPEPDEPLTDRQGNPLGVTRDELAMEAVRDYVHGYDERVPGLDIASTYGGRP